MTGVQRLDGLDLDQRTLVAELVFVLQGSGEVTRLVDHLLGRGYVMDAPVRLGQSTANPTSLAAFLIDKDDTDNCPGLRALILHLVARGSSPNATGADGEPLLRMAYWLPHPDNLPLMDGLLKAGADPEGRDLMWGEESLLTKAIVHGEYATAHLLVAHGADLLPDKQGTTPLGFLMETEDERMKGEGPEGEPDAQRQQAFDLARLMLDKGAGLEHAVVKGLFSPPGPFRAELEQRLLDHALGAHIRPDPNAARPFKSRL